MSALRLGIVADYAEERWSSMDLCAEMLLRHAGGARAGLEATRLEPEFHRRWSRVSAGQLAFNADRLINRYLEYPVWLRRQRSASDIFHVVDHSYAHLVHVLPPARTGVFCHDLDLFDGRAKSPVVRTIGCLVLAGLRKAAVVFYSNAEIRHGLERLVDPGRLVECPYGVAEEFVSATNPGEDDAVARRIGSEFVLHVGSCIPRKRIDVLLSAFAAVRAQQPCLRLVQVGGEWNREQQMQIDQLALGQSVMQWRDLSRATLASLYRQARLVLLPSESEGFCLPIIEGLACGALVVASDIPVLRRVGESAIVYSPVGDPGALAHTVLMLLTDKSRAPALALRLQCARAFSWIAHAETIVASYARLQGLSPICE